MKSLAQCLKRHKDIVSPDRVALIKAASDKVKGGMAQREAELEAVRDTLFGFETEADRLASVIEKETGERPEVEEVPKAKEPTPVPEKPKKTPTPKPKPVVPHDDWRNNLFKARVYAISLGITDRFKGDWSKLDEIVTFIDGFLEAKKGIKPVKPEETRPKPTKADLGTPGAFKIAALADFFLDLIKAGEKLNKVQLQMRVAEALGTTRAAMLKDPKFLHKPIEEAFEYAIVMRAREIIQQNEFRDREAKYGALKALYESQPLLATRTGTSIKQQAYSTPVHLAYLAQEFSGINKNTSVYEPTAGTGMLLTKANPANIHANETDRTRREILRDQHIDNVTGRDAKEYAPGPKSDDIVMANPPFGAEKKQKMEGFLLSKLEHKIMIPALSAMKDDGKAAFIIGGNNFKTTKGMVKDSLLEADRIFFNWLYRYYNVERNIDIPGDEYGRQGTSFPVRLLIVNGRKASPEGYSPTSPEDFQSVESVDDLLGILKEVENERKTLDLTRTEGVSQPTAAPGAPGGRGGRQGQLFPSVADEGTRPPGQRGEPGPLVPPVPTGVEPPAGPAEGGPPVPDVGVPGVAEQAPPSGELPGEEGELAGPAGGIIPEGPGTGRAGKRPGVEEGAGEPGPSGIPGTGGGLIDQIQAASSDDLDALFKEVADEMEGDAVPHPEPPKLDETAPTIPAEKEIPFKMPKEIGRKPIRQYLDWIDERAARRKPKRKPKEPRTKVTGVSDDTKKGIRTLTFSDPFDFEFIAAEKQRQLAKGWQFWREQFGDQGHIFQFKKYKAPPGPPQKPPKTPEKPPTLKDIGSELKKGAQEALTGLDVLFGGKDKLRSGIVFDNESYQAAKPHFQSALNHALNAGYDLKQYIKFMMERYGSRIWPYLKKFIEEQKQQTTEYQVQYRPKSKGPIIDETLTPRAMADSIWKALSDLESRVGDIDKFVQGKLQYETKDDLYRALSADQIDAVALAIDNIDKNQGMIIGDQTGVGKGRVAASMIRYAHLQGKKPIFFTEKANLFTDMHRDILDIGHAWNPFILASDEKKAAILSPKTGRVAHPVLKQSDRNRYISRIISEGVRGLGSFDTLITNYSQINQPNRQRRVIESLARDNIIVLDESHNASGNSQTGHFIMQVLRNAKGALYLSATFAKRPDTMPVYYRTGLSDSNLTMDQMVDAVTSGGTPLQEILSSDLASVGQYIRREKSFTGIDNIMIVDTENRERDERRSDQNTTIIRDILSLDTAFMRELAQAASQAKRDKTNNVFGIHLPGSRMIGGRRVNSTVKGSNFAATVHNSVRQLLLCLKCDLAIEYAVKEIDAGRKPIIGLANTMESFLEDEVSFGKIGIGSPMTDLTFEPVLNRQLRNILRVTIKDAGGNKTQTRVDLNQLSPEFQARYRQIEQKIIDTQSDIPGSPIDHIKLALARKGYAVDELTGRSWMADISDTVNAPLRKRSASEKSEKNAIINGFNNGTIDVLVVNQAGSAGLSLHSSPKFKDKRPRSFIGVQFELNIDTEVQKMGRINRKGQVNLPRYYALQLDIPAETRPAAIHMKKLASLSANTSANSSSVMALKELPDMINKYGDRVATEFLVNNPDIAISIGINLQGSRASADMAALSGKMAVHPVSVQREFWSQTQEEYELLIQDLKEEGTYDLEVSDLNFRAKTLDKVLKTAGTKESSPFGRSTYIERLRVQSDKKPFRHARLKKEIDERLGLKTGREVTQELIQTLDDETNQYIEEKTASTPPGRRFNGGVARATFHSTRSRLQSLIIGNSYLVSVGEGLDMMATLIDIKRQGRAGHPARLSKVKAVFAVNHPIQKFSVPLSRIGTGSRAVGVQYLRQGIDPNWDEFTPDEFHMERYVMTGNLLQGFSAAPPQSRVIRFSMANGSMRQGILTPLNYSVPVDDTIRINADQAIEVALRGNDLESEDISIKSTDRRTYTISVPRSQRRGSIYFMNEDLSRLSQSGEFESVATEMRATFTRDNLPDAIRILTDIGVKFDVSRDVFEQVFEQGETVLSVEGKKRPGVIPPGQYEAPYAFTKHQYVNAKKAMGAFLQGLKVAGLSPGVIKRLELQFKPFISLEGKNFEKSLDDWIQEGVTPEHIKEAITFQEFQAMVEVSLYRANLGDLRETAVHTAWHVIKRMMPAKDQAIIGQYFQTEEGEAEGYVQFVRQNYEMIKRLPKGIRRIYMKIRSILAKIRNALNGKGFTRSEDIFGKAMLGLYESSRFVSPGETLVGMEVEPPLAPWTYSKLIDVVENAKDMPRKVQSLRNWLKKKVKPAELKWYDVEAWLKENQVDGKIDKTAFLDYLIMNEIDVKEIIKGGRRDFDELDESDLPELTVEEDLPELTAEAAAEIEMPDFTRHDRWTLEGGKNYGELLLTLPETVIKRPPPPTKLPPGWTLTVIEESHPLIGQRSIEIRDDRGILHATRYSTRATDEQVIRDFLIDHADRSEQERREANLFYEKAHWEESNVLVHVRFNERLDAQGNRILFIEEIQSDWHQKGKKEGYKGERLQELKNDRNEYTGIQVRLQHFAEQMPYDDRPQSEKDAILKLGDRLNELDDKWEGNIFRKFDIEGLVPDAPLKENWHEFAFKRMLRWAAENGFDRVAWTTGEQQAKRYDLRKFIDTLDYYPTRGYLIAYKDGEQVLNEYVKDEDRLVEVVGKDIAKRLLARPIQKKVDPLRTDEYHRIEGYNLAIGGKGMEVFYDELLPGFARKYGKQWGAKIGSVKIETDVVYGKGYQIDDETLKPIKPVITAHSIDITPQMREAVLFTGQTMFQAKPRDDSKAFADKYIRETLAAAKEKTASDEAKAKADRIKAEQKWWTTEYQKESVKTALGLSKAYKTRGPRKGRWIEERPDTTFLDRWLRSAEFYFQKVPAAWRVFESSLDRVDMKNQWANQLTDNEALLHKLSRLQKQRPKDYQTLTALIKRADMNKIRYNPEQLRKKGYSDQLIEAWQAYRTIMDKGFDALYADMAKLISDYEKRGMPVPEVSTWVGDRQIKVNLKVALAQMGQMRGWYAPRRRRAGKFMLIAKKKGSNPVLKFFDLGIKNTELKRWRTAINRATPMGMEATRLENEGYTVTIQSNKNIPEDLFALAGKTLGLEAMINQALDNAFGRAEEPKKLSDFGLDWTRRNLGPGKSDFIVRGPANKKMNKVFKQHGGIFYSSAPGEPRTWHFPNAEQGFEWRLARSLAVSAGIPMVEETELLFAHALATEVANIVKARGFRGSMIKRGPEVAEDVWIGYETDPLKSAAQYVSGISGGLAKKEMASRMVRAISGTDVRPEQFEKYEDYLDEVKKRRIDPAKQKNIWRDTMKYMDEMLRNDEFADRVIGVVKGVTVLKYLGFRLAALPVNLSSLATSVPASMHGYADVPLHKVPTYLVKALNLYRQYRWGDRSKVDPDMVKFFEHMELKRWDNAQYNLEALSVLQSKLGRTWGKLVGLSMFLFGATEKLNRIATLGATYLALQDQGQIKANEGVTNEAKKLAKHVSDRSHGVYGKTTRPFAVQGSNPFAQGAKMFYVFSKFSHTYLQNMYELGFKKRDRVALAYMMMSPAVLAGAAAIPVIGTPLLWALGKILSGLGDDRPEEGEEQVYAWLADNMGDMTSDFARHGLGGGLAGINVKGSLKIDVGEGLPESLPELLGAPGNVLTDIYYGGKAVFKGQYLRGLEQAGPRATGSILKGVREAREGVTTRKGVPKMLDDVQMKPNTLDTVLSVLNFNPAHMAKQKEIKWSRTKLKAKYQAKRSDIYTRLRAYFSQPHGTRSYQEYLRILADINEYNAMVTERKLYTVPGISYITKESQKRSLRLRQ